MEIIYDKCCGLDIHKNLIVACIICGRKKELRKFGAMTDDILDMISWLKENEIDAIAMEATCVYWKPIYNLLEDETFRILVVNAQFIKGVPGRKTDVKDAEWICDVTRHGLVKNSYIPSREDRELREITRYRQSLIEERSRELNRIQATLEGANIKLGSVVTDISGKTSMEILSAIADGNTNPQALSQLAKGSLINKKEVLEKALKGSLGAHQLIMIRHQVEHIKSLNLIISQLDEDISQKTEEKANAIERLDEIPGIGKRTAERILAEIGFSMEQFPTSAHLCSWAGLVPCNNESAGKKKNTRLRKGNKYVKTVLIECALSAVRKKNCKFRDKYKAIASRRGGKRAAVAIAHKLLIIIYHMLKNNSHYIEQLI